MKSRTSFFNPTVFKKNLTRFAPVWVLYSLMLLMVLTALLDMGTPYHRSLNLVDAITAFALVNLCYALVNVQLLFGDLYNARLCNALHAMPLTRECWFFTNIASALVFTLVPNAVFSLMVMPMLGSAWSLGLWFFLGTTLQYLFFLGTAAFSAMLSGNRFAQVLLYGLINFLSLLFYWFACTLYEPLMYGVSINAEDFTIWCPVYTMAESYDLIDVIRTEIALPDGSFDYPGTVAEILFDSGSWWYLVICTAIGIALGAAALALYRRRALEAAGDFIAVKAVEPVFLVLFTLGVGAFFQLFGRSVGNTMEEYLFLVLGLVVGYFTGRMLILRTTRVFQKKSFLGLGAIAAVLVLSIVLFAMDAFGIVRHVPKQEDVKSISFSNAHYHHQVIEVTDPAGMNTIQDIHRYAVENIPEGWNATYPTNDYYNGIYYTTLYLTYEFEDGSHMERRYSIPVESEPGQILKEYYTDVEYILGTKESELGLLADQIYNIHVEGESFSRDNHPEFFEDGSAEELLRAIAADCKTGNMIQDWGYHGTDESRVYIEFEVHYAVKYNDWMGLYIYDSCSNTLSWLEDHGFEFGEGLYGG